MSDEVQANQISNMLKAFRKKKGLSVNALAKELGVSRNAVANWEAGVALPSMKSMNKLSDVMSESLGTIILAKRRSEIKKSQK